MEQSRKPAVAAEAHLGLVHLCANRFRERGIEYEELYSAGCLGLVKAANAFDPERGVCFSTYAVPVILGEIRRLFREGGSIHVGRRLQELGINKFLMNFIERVQAPPWKGAIKFIKNLFTCGLSRETEEIFIYQLFVKFNI